MTNETIKSYATLKAARIAASHIRKQDNVTRCNVFLKSVMLKSGLIKRDRRGKVIAIPSVYIVKTI